MLHKTIANSLKDVDAARGIVCGYASSFNVVDDGNDAVMPGAFTKTIAEQGPGSKQPRIKFLFEHDTNAILGIPQVLKEDGFGLYFEAKIAQTTLGRDVLLLYQEGCITEHSIGYETIQAEWDRGRAVRQLKELRLYEFSAVTWGMNPQTPTVAVKSLADPSNLSTLAARAAKLDHLLHHGDLRSDTLCQSLERELKSLHAALAPSTEAERPYDIKGVLDSMNDLAARLSRKSATGKTSWPLGDRKAEWDNGAAHKRIVEWASKEDGSLDVAKMKSVHFYSPEGDDAQDKSKYKLLFCDIQSGDVKAMPRAIFACAGSHGVDATSGISDTDKTAIKKKITTLYHRMADEFEDDSIVSPFEDAGKGADVSKHQVKGTGGTVEVGVDGTHQEYKGTHTHAHKAFGSQGADDMHEHEHEHKGDAQHDHEHAKASAHPHKAPEREKMQKAPNGRTIRKARDFSTLFAALNESDQLQDDWGDTFIAFVQCMEELMWQSCMQNGGYMPEGAPEVDIEEAAKANLDAFSEAVMGLVTRSVAADFVPQMTCDGDQFIDPDGPNAEGDMDDDYYKSRRKPTAMPDAPAPLRKAGRAISGANRETITKALDGMSEAMKSLKAHHGVIADLMTKTDPDAVRQDEDDTQGDDDTENGGTNPNKGSRFTPRNHPAPERQEKAATTQGFDLSFMDDTLTALQRRS